MVKVIGVRFRTAGKIYYFDPMQLDVKKGDHVIVETARGIEFGTVMLAPKEVEDQKVIQPLKPVLRIASEKDIEQEASNRVKEKEAYQVCLEKIRKHELEMKLIDAEYTFDNNKVLFYFTADGRIDFRELVKDLAAVFKTRIELRQIGVRDETKIVGGIGICGRPLCCHAYLAEFAPVSIKMAKEQNLSLNPTKISGVCGRLMCCLNNEEETYEELNRKLPNQGDFVTMDDGSQGEVQSINVLRQIVRVLVEDGDEKELKEYAPEQITSRRRHAKGAKKEASGEEAKELRELEKMEKRDREDEKAEKGEKASRDRGHKNDRQNGERQHANRQHGNRQGAENAAADGQGEERTGDASNGGRHERNRHGRGDRQAANRTGGESGKTENAAAGGNHAGNAGNNTSGDAQQGEEKREGRNRHGRGGRRRQDRRGAEGQERPENAAQRESDRNAADNAGGAGRTEGSHGNHQEGEGGSRQRRFNRRRRPDHEKKGAAPEAKQE